MSRDANEPILDVSRDVLRSNKVYTASSFWDGSLVKAGVLAGSGDGAINGSL